MVHNKLHSVTLSAQSRMMPEMARLLTDIYPSYRTSDLVDVANRCSPPAGALHSMWWWDVSALATEEGGESIDPVARSYVNKAEATAAVALVQHFVRSGINPSDITVLASYSAQVSLIQKHSEMSQVQDMWWPVSHLHGPASRNLLATLKEKNPGATGSRRREAHVQQLVHISETFLKLGEVGDALSSLQQAKKLADGANAVAIHSSEERVKKLDHAATQVSESCKCIESGQGPSTDVRDIISNAIDSLKQIAELTGVFRALGAHGVPAAAASCLLAQRLTKEIDETGKCTDGVKKLLNSMDRGAKAQLQELKTLEGVTFSSIDRYQGSENDVVIVSLVRSNPDHNVGFLSESARRVVAQSRARLGMYFVADRSTFSSNRYWKRLINEMCACERLGPKIPLVCPAHRSRNPIEVASESAAELLECGICREPCDQLMSCGKHRCKQRCHGSGVGVELHMICDEDVQDVCCSADHAHAIKRKCYQTPADVRCGACEDLERERKEKEKREAEARERQAKIDLEKQIEDLRQAPARLRLTELLRDTKEDVAEYLAVMDRTEKYVQADHNNPIQVLRIDKVHNPYLEKRFLEAKRELRSSLSDCKTRDLFHGSSDDGVKGITEKGFRLPEWNPNNMFGRGIYFATDSSKSAQHLYTKGSKKLILCDVLLGNVCTVDGLKSKHPLSKHVKINDNAQPPRHFLDVDYEIVHRAGFDSVFAPRGGSMAVGGVKYDEMIVYRVEQALPKYIIHYGKYAHAVATPSLSSSNFHIREVKPTRNFNENDQDQMHFRVCESHLLRQAPKWKLLKIELVENPMLMQQFEEQRSTFQKNGIPSVTVLAFHATRFRSSVDQIVRKNFDPKFIGSQSDSGWWGKGFYFSEFPGISLGYGGNFLLCKVLPGKTFEVTERMDGKPLKTGFNSHRLNMDYNGYGKELVIDNPKQILPCYILHITDSV